MAVILVTGANGQLGNEIKAASLMFHGYDFIFTDIDTLDLTNGSQVANLTGSIKPDWIINCAAYTQVDKSETEPDLAMKINAIAVKNIVEAIKGSDIRLIHISSDYVYEGTGCTPYDESSPVNPQSSYGRSKLAGERYALLHPSSMVIRTSWLYSVYGNNFVKTIIRNAREKGHLNVVYDQTGTPTWAADLASAIISILSGVIRNHFAMTAGIYNYSDEGVCSWYDFACEIITETGISCTIDPVLTTGFHQIARRPSYSVLNKSKIKETYGLSIPHWRNSLGKCIKLMI
jgi:dTDP-4-dehydrorhamnose reductase